MPRLVRDARAAQAKLLSAHFDSADDRLHPAIRDTFRSLAAEQGATPDSVAKRLPVVASLQMLKTGEFEYPNPFAPEPDRFSIDGAYVEKMVRNFERDQRKGHEPLVTYGHPWDLGAAPADAWVVSAEPRPSGLFGSLKLHPLTADAVAEDRWRYFSATFHDNWPDENGKKRGPSLLAGAITNFPFLRGMQVMRPATFSARVFAPRTVMSTPLQPTNEQPTNEQPNAQPSAEDRIKALEASLADERAKREAAERDAEALEASVAAVGRELAARPASSTDAADSLRAIVREAEGANGGECRLPPAMKDSLLPGFEADPVKALAASPLFRGSVRALKAHLAALPPVVTVGKQRVSTSVQADTGAGVAFAATQQGDEPTMVNGVVQLTDAQARERGFASAKEFNDCLAQNRRALQAWSVGGSRPNGLTTSGNTAV